MTAFPLFMTDKYYNIQDDKMYFMIFSTAICLIMAAAVFAYELIVKKSTKTENRLAAVAADKTAEAAKGKKSFIKEHFCRADLFAAGFFLVLIISTCTSKWLYEAFWGNMGRYQGLYLWFFYFAGYILISRFYEPEKWHMDLFLAAGIAVSLWGVLDFFYMSPIGWQAHAKNYTAFDFSSTMGNVNLLTAFEGMILGISSVMFIGEKSVPRSIFYYITAFTAVLGLICGFSDNALISLGAVICFLPFYAFKERSCIIRYLGLLAGFSGSLVFMERLISAGLTTISRQHWGILLELCADHAGLMRLIFIAVTAVLIAVLILYATSKKNIEKYNEDIRSFDERMAHRLRLIWCVLGVAAIGAIIYIFYDANTGGHPDRYAPYSTYLIFDDNWGTRRGYNWNLAFGYMEDFTFFKRLFGSGPETYPIFTYSHDYYNMVNAFAEVYDSPHNEWIQYLFTTGILGVITYYGWVISSVITGFRAELHQGAGMNVVGSACAYGIIVYTLVSFVNISAPVLTPMVILCMGICSAAGRYSKEIQGIRI